MRKGITYSASYRHGSTYKRNLLIVDNYTNAQTTTTQLSFVMTCGGAG